MQAGAGWEHGCSSRVDGVDDFVVVDALEIDAGDAEVGVSELALDHVERDPFAGHLDGMSVTQLMRREAAAYSGVRRESAKVARTAAGAHGRPRVGPAITQNSAPTGSSTRASSQGRSCSQPHGSMPISRRRPPLPRRTRIDPRAGSRSLSASASASLILRPARQSTTISARVRAPKTLVAGVAHDRDDLLDAGRIGRVAHPLVAGRAPSQVAGQGGGRATPSRGVNEHSGHRDLPRRDAEGDPNQLVRPASVSDVPDSPQPSRSACARSDGAPSVDGFALVAYNRAPAMGFSKRTHDTAGPPRSRSLLPSVYGITGSSKSTTSTRGASTFRSQTCRRSRRLSISDQRKGRNGCARVAGVAMSPTT